MDIFAEADRDEGEVEIERQLDAVIGEVEDAIGFRSCIEVGASLHPNGDLWVRLANPNAKEEALGSSLYEDEIDWAFFERAKGDPLQLARDWVRSKCEPEVLRQKRQAEILEAIDGLLVCGEERLPVPRRWSLRRQYAEDARPDLIDEVDDEDEERPPVKKKPRQGPPPSEQPVRGNYHASVCFDPPDGLWVRLTEGHSGTEVAKARRFTLPGTGDLTEVFEWIRATDRQGEETGDPDRSPR